MYLTDLATRRRRPCGASSGSAAGAEALRSSGASTRRATSGGKGAQKAVHAAIVSTYPPRACGIGAFAADVRAALLGTDGVERVERVVIVNEPSRPQRPGLVATVAQGVRGDYVRAARILGRLDVDVVLLQHEYGIFGGEDGDYVLSLVEDLPQPLVVTLHTVLVSAVAASGRPADGTLRRGGAGGRDDGDGEAPAGRGRILQ